MRVIGLLLVSVLLSGSLFAATAPDAPWNITLENVSNHEMLVKLLKNRFDNLDGLVDDSAFSSLWLGDRTHTASRRAVYLGCQPRDSDLTALSMVNGDANEIPYYISSTQAGSFLSTAWGRSWMAVPDVATALGVLGIDPHGAITDPNLLALETITGPWQRIVTTGTTNADILSAKSQLHLDGYSILDYGAVSGTGDDSTAFTKAIAAAMAVGGKVIVPPGTWNINSTLAVSLTGDLTVEGQGYPVVIIGDSDSEYLSFASNESDSSITLTGNVTRGGKAMVVDNASALSSGDVLWPRTTVDILDYGGQNKEEIQEVNSVVGTTINLAFPLQFSYATTDAGLAISTYHKRHLTISGIHFQVPNTSSMLAVSRADLTLRDCTIEYTKHATAWGTTLLLVNECIHPVVENCQFIGDANGWLAYGIEVARCRGARLTNNTFTNMWTPVAPGYWSNDVVIDGMVATGTRSGLDSHSAMGVTYRHFYVDGDLRGAEVPVGFACFGGTLEDGVLVNRAPAGHENIFLLGAEAYLNADTAFYSSSDSDLTLRNVKISYPNLSTSTGAFRFQATHGRKLSIQDCDLGIFQVAAADAPTDTPYIFRKVYVDGGHYQRIGVPNGSEAWVSDANLTSGIAGVSDNNDIGLHAYATAIHVRNCSFTGYKYATYMYGVGPLWMDGCTITGCTNASGNDGTVVQSVWTNCVIDGLTNWYDIDNAAMRMGQCVLTSGTPMPSNAKGEVLAKLAITDANTPAGATSKALPAYDANGILIGYVPVYSGKW